jgi:hypothetical protein
MANNSTHGSNPAVYKKLPYDAIKDFSPIILIASTPYVLTAHPSLPVKTVKELVALAKKRPGDLNYGSAGNGSTHHLSGELLNMMAGTKLIHVPYKGTTPALTGLLSGEVSVMFFTVVGYRPNPAARWRSPPQTRAPDARTADDGRGRFPVFAIVVRPACTRGHTPGRDQPRQRRERQGPDAARCVRRAEEDGL